MDVCKLNSHSNDHNVSLLFITTSSVKETHKDSAYIFLTSVQNECVLKNKQKPETKVKNHA